MALESLPGNVNINVWSRVFSASVPFDSAPRISLVHSVCAPRAHRDLAFSFASVLYVCA